MRMFRAEKMSGRTVHVDGIEYLYFSGTSYLGLSNHPHFKAHLLDGLERYGSNFGGSRRSNLQIPLYEEAEALLAHWVGTEAALTVSSGTMAGQLVVKTLQQSGHPLFFAPGIHPALEAPAHHFDGTFDDWTTFILGKIGAGDWKVPPVLALTSINVLHAQRYDLSWISELPADVPIIILIDDSHGLGVWGKNGSGVFTDLPVKDNLQYIIVSSLGKAFGVPGGMIACSKELRRLFWENAFFGGASPLVPAYLYALLHSKDLILQQLRQLRSNIRLFHSFDGIKRHFQYLTDYPVFFSKHQRLAHYLAKKRILISSFPYPGPKDPVITRVVLSASHEEKDIFQLINYLDLFFQDNSAL